MKRTRRRISSPKGLSDAELIDSREIEEISNVAQRYAIGITPTIATRIERPGDGVGRQFIPTVAELLSDPLDDPDPIADARFTPVPGITHRYPDRVLLKPTHTCPVYCRFCFRRETVGPGSVSLSATQLTTAFDYIRQHPEVWEVILTGGDPLILAPRKIEKIMEELGTINHIRTIRVHTRIPVVDPGRITPELLDCLTGDKVVWLVIHCNHPDEIGEDAVAAFRRIAMSGIPMLSQTVLLKGVNNDPEVLDRLFRTLIEHRVKPYYLHHPDLAPGTAHFRTSIAQGQELMDRLRSAISGICQPLYVLDIPGGFGKVPINPSYLAGGEGNYTVRDIHGNWHRYPPDPASESAMPGASQ
ncbi:lysine-2,3-aminomutase-like protein [Nocardia farcinica]|uniref:lysine-2,3-aminomutase-like protein n=1 Tax=Nocardia farcinica TaxID=37329 RepID=UPI002453F328|nr:lysine-2,3-aminomutase-like protein [Nocardia farcinica]